jgi:hypothetical protein
MRCLFCIAITAVLNVSLSFTQNSTTPPRTGGAEDYTFSVPADQTWVDTHIDLYPGDRVYVSGAVIECGGLNHTSKINVPIPSAPIGALLAKLQLEAHPILATPDAQLAIVDPSHIYLGVNG